jgi:hypothetical protein
MWRSISILIPLIGWKNIVLNKLFIVDIDGVINNYPDHLLNYAKERYGLNVDNITDLKNNKKYKEIKLSYRISGAKLNQEIRPEALEFIKKIKSNSWAVWIVTSRPDVSKNHENTRLWLSENQVFYDRLIFCRNKFFSIKGELDDALCEFSMIDDQKNFLENVIEGMKVYYPKIKSNFYLYGSESENKIIKTIYDFSEIDIN